MMHPRAQPSDAEALDNCAREAIHQIQLVQPHGFLIACDRHSGVIRFASENTGMFLKAPPAGFPGHGIVDLMDGAADMVREQLQAIAFGSPALVDLRFRSEIMASDYFEVLAHRVGDTVVIETMPFVGTPATSAQEQQQIEGMLREVGTLHRQESLAAFLQVCTSQIRHLSGYQRVFIYRFLPDWSGEVIAESTAAETPTRFLGLRFPASDIPAQARELYRTNLLRVIGDVDAAPVALRSHPDSGMLDQSHSLLRSPSPMHLRYLQNMGVKATMTISLLKHGELWGMVSCHHDAPRVPPVDLRRMTKLLCGLLAEVAVVRLDAMLHAEVVNKTLRFRTALNKLTKDITAAEDFPVVAGMALAEIADVMHVQGFGLLMGGQWICPPPVGPALQAYLLRQAGLPASADLFQTHQLGADATLSAADRGPWAGAMVVPVPGAEQDTLILLRHEVVQQVKWAGAPSKETIGLANGLRVLGPRQSFESWTEFMQGQSNPWGDDEQAIMREVAKSLGDAHLVYRGRRMQAELRMLGSCMEHLNDMVVVTDTESVDEPGPRILYVNQAFVDKTGYSREEVVGRSPRLMQGPLTDRNQLDLIREAMKTWSPVTVELVNYKKNGDSFWVEVSLAPIADSSGWFTHWVAIERDIDDRKRSEATMQQLVNYDPLTGLPNRRLLMDRLPIALSLSRRFGRNGALLFVDLDNFKDLNDTEGHHVGDDLLKQVAQRLSSIVRFEDTVARLGGDEFVIMLENLSPLQAEAAASAQQIAEKIIALIARPYDLSGHSYSTTASLGLTLFQDHDGERSVEELFKQADFAMYQSKAAGRNTWRFFDPMTQAALVERNALESDLKHAFANHALELHYQPIVDSDRNITGVEALMRWKHATRGWVSPLEFIAIAEYSGLIVPLGRWAFQQACDQLVRWSACAERASWSIAVNVSARQIRQADFVAVVKELIACSGCNPHLLKLELTESLLQHDFDATIAKMDALRALGVEFSIDDFGTGYSSLAYLQRLPISVLKIDRSFVRDIGSDQGDMGICMMILALGKTLGLSIVAEGVEDLEQFAFLKEHGCDKFQGYLFSKAVPAAALAFSQSTAVPHCG